MSVYYNEIDQHCAEWLRALMRDGLIPDGVVDTRSITEVEPDDLAGFDQCHFFAGIGGWPYALDLAGWPRNRPVWTGSCPCQPFSVAGKGLGANDERHLWPVMRDLVAERRPPVVFGEQVASKDGRVWLAGVRADLEALGYAVGSADLCAAGVGAPHIRQRLFWVADASGAQLGGHRAGALRVDAGGQAVRQAQRENAAIDCGSTAQGSGGLADTPIGGPSGRPRAGRQDGEEVADGSGVGDAQLLRARAGTEQGAPTEIGRDRSAIAGAAVQRLEYAIGARPQGYGRSGLQPSSERREDQKRHCAEAGAWGDFDLVACADGVARLVESGTFPLAHGLPRSLGPRSTRKQRVDLRTAKRNRRVRLKGYGNAIVPQVAAEFIAAFMETTE